jgi:hypothetical protein
LSLFTTSLIISKRLALPTKSLLNLWTFCFTGDLKPLDHWIDAIEDATLMFSDQQFVAGLAFLPLDIRSLAVYYWQIVVYLAWFSSFIHLATLTAQRNFFHGQQTLHILHGLHHSAPYRFPPTYRICLRQHSSVLNKGCWVNKNIAIQSMVGAW